MLDLSLITARLTSQAPTLAQVLIPEAQEVYGVDSSAVLVSTLDATIGSRVYVSIFPVEPTYPAAVYEQSNSERIDYDGYPILRADEYFVAVAADTHLAASTSVESMRSSLLAYDPTNAAGSADLFGKATDFNPEFERYEISQSVQLTHLARASQALPAAFVYPLWEEWEEDGGLSCVTGQWIDSFAVLVVAKVPAGGVSALDSLQEEVRQALVAYVPTGWSRIEPAGGSLLKLHSAHVVWREAFVARKVATYT